MDFASVLPPRLLCHRVFCALAVRATVELFRFLGILFVIIPSLACTFVGLGLLFHMPRIFGAYVRRGLINVCWWHMLAANAPREKARKDTSSGKG